ncbi:hypothetical protein OF83DRAFT_810627 [Amylostereum chailletii]|nr:hypothetical protein OF83DRAFT_810627 [Amylostereum chailletii]
MAEPLPPTVEELLKDRQSVRRRYSPRLRPYSAWRVSKRPKSPLSTLCLSRTVDTPSACFYRLYELYVIDDNIGFRNELEYFCIQHPSWAVCDIADPVDPVPLRYAILASLTRWMCEAFNRRIGLGLSRDAPAIIEDFSEWEDKPKVYEELPPWVSSVQPLKERVYIPDVKGCISEDNGQYVDKELRKLNVIAVYPHMHFI